VDVLSTTVAAIALVVSVIVFLDNRRQTKAAARLARQPALVYAWDGVSKRWTLSNIGSGPALDVVIIQRIEGQWAHPLRMPEMGVAQEAVVPRLWIEKWDPDPGLGARYRSITGERYMTRTVSDSSQMENGWGDTPPDLWETIEPHWQYRQET
jgi:hypothetical protein